MESKYLHEVVITAIVIKDGKYLITRRAKTKKRFPGKWTVPGGKMETDDYLKLPKDTEFYWYNVLERTLKREVQEEVNLEIDNIWYVTSLATVHEDGSPSLVISCARQIMFPAKSSSNQAKAKNLPGLASMRQKIMI
jgi:8-oxo-dGTP pyrophosphatase MutT (NUDIX family)